LKQINTDNLQDGVFPGLLLAWHGFLKHGSGRLFSSNDALLLPVTGGPLWSYQDVQSGSNIWVMIFLAENVGKCCRN
jgi:hypothetical protein